MNVSRMRNVWSLVAVALVVALLPGGVASARMAGTPYKLRMDGYVGAPPKGRNEIADLQIRAGAKDVRFQVTRATVLSGNTMPATIFRRVRPYRPNFFVRGSQELVSKVENAADGDRLRIIGIWRPGSRNLMVATVEPQPAEAPAAAAPAPTAPAPAAH